MRCEGDEGWVERARRGVKTVWSTPSHNPFASLRPTPPVSIAGLPLPRARRHRYPSPSSLFPAPRSTVPRSRRSPTPSPSSPAWKVILPYPRPSRRFMFTHLNRSLFTSSDGPNPTTTDSSNPTSSPPASVAMFTARHQELGTPWRGRPPPQVLKQVWQSSERYMLDQFEAMSRAFSKTHLSSLREPTPLAVESHFWKASADRPIYIEYANDVLGSGFAAPVYSLWQKKRKPEGAPMDEGEKTRNDGSGLF